MGSFIQSNLGSSNNNFELVVLERQGLAHYHRDNVDLSSNPSWVPTKTVTRNATGAGSLIQSTLDSATNLELVVLQGTDMVHYWRDNEGKWHPTAVAITSRASGSGSLIQNTSGTRGNFELIVREDNELYHFYRDNSNSAIPWHRCRVITNRATARGALVQNSGRAATAPGNLDVVVLEANLLVHYYHDSPDYMQPWHRAATITEEATGPGSLIRSSRGGTGRLEVLVPQRNEIVHYYQSGSNPSDPWIRGGIVSSLATGAAAFIQSTLGDYGSLEAIVQQKYDLFHYFHDQLDPNEPWQLGALITDKL